MTVAIMKSLSIENRCMGMFHKDKISYLEDNLLGLDEQTVRSASWILISKHEPM